jgi:HSP20 family protein
MQYRSLKLGEQKYLVTRYEIERRPRMLTWDPTREFGLLPDELNALFSGASGAVHEFPAVNVWSTDDEACVTAELPGIDASELEISVMGDTLTLRAARRPHELQQNEKFHRRERMHGRTQRTVKLPFRVEPDKVDASMTDGVLMVRLPRAEVDKPRKIAIKSE